VDLIAVPVLRVGIIQRVLASYRLPFFQKLGEVTGLTFSTFAGQGLPDEAIHGPDTTDIRNHWATKNYYFRSPAGIVCWQSGLSAWLRRFRPGVLILDTNPRILSSWLAVWQMKRWKYPVIGWGLGELPRSGPRWLRKLRALISIAFIRKLDGVIGYSTKAARHYIAAGVPPNRVFVACNSTDTKESEYYLSKLEFDSNWPKSWRESLRLNPELPIVLSVGRLIGEKKIDALIRACAPLFDRCQLLIIGDGPLRSQLELEASLFHDRIRFVGHQTGETLAKSFIASDIFVLPGSGGLAVHQAMSYGKPVIVSFGDGTETDLVREGVNGFFFEPGNVKQLTARLAQIIGQPKKLRAMGRASLKIVRQEINLDKMVQAFLDALTRTRVIEEN